MLKTLHAQRVIVNRRPLLPVLEGESAPDENTEAEITQLYLKTTRPEAVYMCVGDEAGARRWRRLSFGK